MLFAVVPGRSAASGDEGVPSCSEERRAVVTDIDGTLTAGDIEIILQALDPTYDPRERDAAGAVMREYAARGYWIVYVTARPNNGSTRNKTTNWLVGHAFPTEPEQNMLYQAPDILSALLPQPYKTAVVDALTEAGFSVDFAYGNSTTDFGAFIDAGVPPEQVFSIGSLAGYGETTPIEGEAFTQHLADHVSALAPVCGGAPVDPATCSPVEYRDWISWLFTEIFGIPIPTTVLPCGL